MNNILLLHTEMSLIPPNKMFDCVATDIDF